ncbi:MAG: very short patch repair endonuclease [Roseiarcus sp.]
MMDADFLRPSDPARSDLMRRVRQRGTSAEDQVAVVLRELGLYYRRNVRSLPGSPDFANASRHWAVFVNGCFWHHHAGCARATIPTRNRAFWKKKFSNNQLRDAAKSQALTAMGFRVIVIWECEAMKPKVAQRRLRGLRSR